MSTASRSPRRISVALLTGNSAHVLRPMLASLVGQTRPADEIVIHDGGSTDTTRALIAEFESMLPIVVVASPTQRTVGASRALAIEASTGECIAVADHDDVFHPDHLAVLDAHLPGPGTVVTATALLWTPGTKVVPMADEWDLDLPGPDDQLAALASRNVITGMTLFTRSDYDRFGPYRDESFVEDWDLWLRMALGGVRFVRPTVPTLLYRWGHANVSSRRDLVEAAERELIARHEQALRAALGTTGYDAAMTRRATRQAWTTTYGLLADGDVRGARRIARRHLRSGDRRLVATGVLPAPVLRRLLHLPRPTTR